MARNIYGGGSRTNENGLKFEQETSLADAILSIPGYSIAGNSVHYNGNKIAILASKNDLYNVILKPAKIDYKDYISKKLLPDEAIFVSKSRTIYIVEKKFQRVAGSVDEKLQTCDFKKKQYKKLFSPMKDVNVEYIYVLNDWFSKPEYRDVLYYIKESKCHYFFNMIPLDFMCLPHVNEEG